MKTILALLLLFSFQSVTYASSYTVTSVPYQASGFSSGGVSIGTTRSLPIVLQDYPNAVWVPARDGFIPANAIIYQYQNFAPVYYCKVIYEHNNYFGLIRRGNQGCNIPDLNEDQINNYWILVR